MIAQPHTPSEARRSPQRRLRKRFFIVGLLVATGVVAAAIAAFWPSAPDQVEAAPAPSMTVTLGVTGQHAWPEMIEASGAIAPWQEVVIAAQIGGLQLREVRVNVGDHVRRGQVLATFDPAAPRAEHSRLSAALAQARALDAQAETNHQRAESLAGSGAISAQELLRLATEAESAKANVAAARAALDAQEEQLRYIEVRAPDDGVITARAATPGSLGGMGQELFRMIRQGRLEWRGELTAAQLSRTAPGQRVELALPDGGTAHAIVRQAAPSLDSQSRLGLVYADLNATGGARAGMYAEGRIRLPETPSITAPAAAVVLRDGRHYVFTVSARDEAFLVTAREVEVGRRQGDEVELVRGADRGLRIVVSGAGFLKNGDVVREARPGQNATSRAAPSTAGAQ